MIYKTNIISQSEIYKKMMVVHEQAVDLFEDGSKKIMELAELVVHPDYRRKQLGYRLAKVSAKFFVTVLSVKTMLHN